MAIHWQIPFKSLRSGVLYAVNIYDATYTSQTPVILKGGAQPFVTQEDDSDDMFTPIRTQTGYIRIVDDDKDANGNAFDWKDILPSTDIDRPVTLTHVASGQTIVDWQGFMQAQTFSGTLYGNPQEREFPIQCTLSALSASNVSGVERNIHNFAYLIREAFATLTGITFNNYIFQGGENAQTWLLTRIDWQNLINTTDNGVTGAYNNQRVIQDICQLFGWTVRVHKQNVIFACADDTTQTKALVLTQEQLNTMANNSWSPTGDVSTDFLTPLTLSGDIFATTNNDDFLVRGYNKAVVSVDCNQADADIMSIYPESVEKEMINKGEDAAGNDTWYTKPLTTFVSAFLDGNAVVNSASFNMMRHNESYNTISVHDVIRIYSNYNAGTTYATLQTNYQHTFPGGNLAGFRGKGFKMHGSAYRNGERYENYESVSGVGNKTMYMRLFVKASNSEKYYFNGLTWELNVVSSFKVTLGGREDVLYCRDGHGGTVDVIPMIQSGNALHGTVYVEFLGSDDMPESNGNRIFDIADFRIEYVDNSIYETIRGEREDISSTEYVDTNDGKACDEWNADLIYASQNGLARGYGLLIGSDFNFLEKVPYSNSFSDHPEQHLATRVANYWANAKRKIYAELLSNGGVSAGIAVRDISPRHKVTLDGTVCYPIAISRDWREDVSILTLMEL